MKDEKKNENHPAIAFLKTLLEHCESGFLDCRFIHKETKKATEEFILLDKIENLTGYLRFHRNNCDCYFSPATRARREGSKEAILQISSLWLDLDRKDFSSEDEWEKARQKIIKFPLKPSLLISTGGGKHIYWKLKEPASNADILKVENRLKRLASYFQGDRKSTDASHLLRIPGTLNQKYHPAKEVIRIAYPPEGTECPEHNLEDFDNYLPPEEEAPREDKQYTEETNERLNQIMQCEFMRHCDVDRKTLSESEWYRMVMILCREQGGPDLIHRLSRGYPKYSPQETNAKIIHAVNDSGPATCSYIKNELKFDCKKDCGITSPILLCRVGKEDGSITFASQTFKRDPIQWPAPLKEEALHGLAGDFVKMLGPHTEADPAAILIQFLAAWGNVIGRNAFFPVEATRHYLKIFPVLVGETSKGRKGTSWRHVKGIFERVDDTWGRDCIGSGLSSGEGLIWQVRDPIMKREQIREKGRVTDEFQEVVIDAGVKDKRFFVIEEEFASTLKVMAREGNILSPIIRQAWDDGNLRSLAKNSPARATGAHISSVSHVTMDDLRRNLDRTETSNGFANRFIWICVRRSKKLPSGGEFHNQSIEPFLDRLRGCFEFGRSAGAMERDFEANGIWCGVYPNLSEGEVGLFGCVTSRAEAQVLRLACIYAILDKSTVIHKEHLYAALALWDYSEQSAKYIFGDSLGDWIADRIRNSIRDSSQGLTRTEINNLFQRHVEKHQIETALSFLKSHGLIQMIVEDTKGRSVERWITLEGTK